MKSTVIKTLAVGSLLTCLSWVSPVRASNQDASKPAQNAGSPVNKDQASSQFKFSVGSNVVLVPVVVTDKQGKHVTGLKAEDFELKEDGSDQKISQVDEFSAETAKVDKAAAAANTFSNQIATEHPKKLEIIALDQVNTPFASGAQGGKALIEFLSKNVDQNTLLALITFGHNGIHVVHDFTRDPSVLLAAVSKVQSSLNARDARSQNISGDNSEADSEALQLQAIINGQNMDVSSANGLAASLRDQNRGARARADASRQGQEALITLEDLQQVAQYFGGVPGKKSLIWASTGFPFRIGSGAAEVTRGTTLDDWQRTFRALTDANVSIYPVDIGGLIQGASANTLQNIDSQSAKSGNTTLRSSQLDQVTTGAFVDPAEGRHETMRQVAEMTGGQPFYNSNDGAELFRRAGDDAAQYYVLAYHVKDNGKYGWRKLNVKVRRDGTKVRARSGFFFVDPKKEADPSVALRDLRMAMISDLNFGSVPIKGEWLEIKPVENSKDKKVQFVLSIPPGVPLIDAEHENHVSMEFLVATMDGTGKNVGTNISQRLDTKLQPAGVEQIQTKGIDYVNVLTLPPGNYSVHFIVRDNLRKTLGSVVAPLKLE